MSIEAFQSDIIKIHNELTNDENRLSFELCSGKNQRFFHTRHKLASDLYIYVFADMHKYYPDIQIEINTKTNANKIRIEKLNSLVKNGHRLAELNKLDEAWHLSVDYNNRKVVFLSPTGNDTPVGGTFGNCIQLAKYNVGQIDVNNACFVVKQLLSLIGVIKRNEVLLSECC